MQPAPPGFSKRMSRFRSFGLGGQDENRNSGIQVRKEEQKRNGVDGDRRKSGVGCHRSNSFSILASHARSRRSNAPRFWAFSALFLVQGVYDTLVNPFPRGIGWLRGLVVAWFTGSEPPPGSSLLTLRTAE
ncbi:uncharacterized protein CLUP02_02110 [Colletotrichum lupini]|uniref:Uncharacterized protein n=1 Tax=Colletotrichum lupini TaxID=145971 RepID=A0A9Q8W9X1_9PEZI|nr:uncharacterized protein CLUP02_02110 [Colletotrichum lupini]UQC75456.1 hypothetical protein CLUP02_02110 [Colletotrichum lupini]